MNTHLDSFFSLYAIKKIYLCTKEITMNDQTVICAIATAPGHLGRYEEVSHILDAISGVTQVKFSVKGRTIIVME